jgi:hypothetical protein
VGTQHELASELARLVGDLQPLQPADAAALEEARSLVAESLATGPGVLVHRRAVPLTSPQAAPAVPIWARGMRPARTLGPFADPARRPTWFDIFPLFRHVRLVRIAGGTPFMTLPVETVPRIAGGGGLVNPAPSVYAVPAGSVWFATQVVDPGAPAGSWTGVRVTSGTLRFSGAVSQDNDEIVVPGAVTVDLAADPEEVPTDTAAGPGEDARNAEISVPAQFRLTVSPGGGALTVDGKDTARLLAFGFDTQLVATGGPARYDADLGVLAVPMTAQTAPFRVGSVKAKAFLLSGGAPIVGAAWALPVAVVDPANLGDAAGAGALDLWLGEGLTGRWVGQKDPVGLMATVLEADPHALTLIARQAMGDRVEQRPAAPPSEDARIDLRWRTVFPVTFVTEAKGVEAVITTAELTAVFDRPVDLRGERLNVHASSIDVLFVATTAGTFLLVDGALDQEATTKIAGFQLVNALLRATRPDRVVLFGEYNGTKLDHAAELLHYRLLALVPTLPDPYAATYGDLVPALDQRGGELMSVLRWDGASTSFDFRLLTGGEENITELGRSHSDPFAVGTQVPATALAAIATVNPIGDSLAFEHDRTVILLDVSTNVDQFGVAYATAVDAPETLGIDKMNLEVDGEHVVLVTLPAVQWEALETVQDPDPTPLPTWTGFDNSGVPTVIEVPTTALVPVHPSAALDSLVANFAQPSPRPTRARFTLPFGILAVSELTGDGPTDTRHASLASNRPTKGDFTGAHQLRIDAHDDILAAGETAALAGYTVQLSLAQPGNRSPLGHDVDDIFNSYLGATGARHMVPVTRIDLSGYGESLFSGWDNPFKGPGDVVAVVKVQFDVLVGRTALEVVQVRSVLFPYGVVVVRTITMERRNNAVITRSDSGWQAVGDGLFDYPGTTIVTHPGVVTRITGVLNIRDTGQVVTVGGKDMAAVYLDGDLDLDGAASLVPAKGQLGFVQTTAGALIGPPQYADLLARAGTLGGPIDTTINIGGGTQAMHLHQVDVGVTQGMGGPEFAMAVWGAPAFPGGGQWSVVQIEGPTAAPIAVPKDKGLPLIRAGAAGTPPPPSSAYRFADPVDLAQPANPTLDYAVLHSMGTQRALFPRPKIEPADPTRITSTQPGSIADPYTLGTATGPYPSPDKTLPFPTANWALRVDASGHYRLDLPATFPAGVGRRTIRQAGSVKSDVDYTAAQVAYTVDTSQPVPWRFRLDNASKIMTTTAMGDVINLASNIVAAADDTTRFQQPNLTLGGSLSIVQDLLTILAELGITGVLTALMTNDWSLKVAEAVPVVDARGDALQVPPKPADAQIKFDDTEVKVEVDVLPTADQATFEMGGQPMFAINSVPGLYVVIIVKFGIQVSTKDGTVYSLLIGIGFAYDKEIEPFEFKGKLAVTFAGVSGDTVFGYAVGFLLSLEASIDPIVSLQLSLEGQLARIDACQGTDHETVFSAAKLTFSIEVTLCLVFSISFEASTTSSTPLRGPGEPACSLPDVLPNAS